MAPTTRAPTLDAFGIMYHGKLLLFANPEEYIVKCTTQKCTMEGMACSIQMSLFLSWTSNRNTDTPWQHSTTMQPIVLGT
jgi:hypothetical protein